MDRPSTDFSDARNMMVDSQVRPNKVGDPRILAAMRRLPRERFLPAALAARAYVDEDVALPNGRALIEPMVLARLVQALAIVQGERALVVGSGTGYGAALIAACGAAVTALEEDEALIAIAGAILPEAAGSVTMATGELAKGWQASAPYDLILIEGAVEHVPAEIAAQLKPRGGRLATVLAQPGGRMCHAAIGEIVASSAPGGGTSVNLRPIFDCGTPVLPQMRKETLFVF